jgi:hypothetical protein
VNGYDLDNPLRVDNCDRCGAIHWRDCRCDPTHPRTPPTPEQIEAARRERLARAERARGAG